jgi:hypothetical protein
MDLTSVNLINLVGCAGYQNTYRSTTGHEPWT